MKRRGYTRKEEHNTHGDVWLTFLVRTLDRGITHDGDGYVHMRVRCKYTAWAEDIPMPAVEGIQRSWTTEKIAHGKGRRRDIHRGGVAIHGRGWE